MNSIASSVTKIFSILLTALTLIVVLINTSTEPDEVVEVVEAKPVDKKQLKCLADNIYYEARGEDITGKAAVARVVMNRVNYGFASTPCNVVYQVTTVTKVKSNPSAGSPSARAQFVSMDSSVLRFMTLATIITL
jgi:hypothetical protein